jgi:Rps23 Pro-64 3,4-dihydroxylase Tpa1-like proline 4-hydroxylase
MSEAAPVPGPLPPWRRLGGFLSEDEHRALLDWTLSNRERFKPARVIAGVDPSMRVAETLRDFGALRALLERRIREELPEIFRGSGARPFEVEAIELEIAAHGDGAFFTRHSDIPIGPDRKPLGGDSSGRYDRLVSAVYYFHREPKAFSGGALRLYRFGGGDGPADHVEIEPEQNSLVVFPSWAEHEVMKVSCPSGAFEDYRFAVNVWLCRSLG